MLNVLLVFIGGGLGSVSRYGIGALIKQAGWVHFPWATLIANVLASSILAIAALLIADRMQEAQLRLLLITGFCGGFSTFSAFAYETVELYRKGATGMMALNVAVNVLLCVAVIYIIYKKA